MSVPSINLTHAFTMTLPVGAPHSIAGTPVGDRSFIPVTGGTFKGEGIDAKVTPNGGDFAIVKDGYLKLDVRIHAVTQDNEALYIQYYGHLEISPPVAKILGGDPSAQSTTFDDQYLLTTPIIEAPSSSKHAWVNHTVFVSKGRFELSAEGAAVVYEIFKAK